MILLLEKLQFQLSLSIGGRGGCLDIIPDCLPGSTTEVDNTEYKI